MDPLFEEYEEYHRHPRNRICHYIGVPLITFSALGLLGGIPFLGLPFSWAIVVLLAFSIRQYFFNTLLALSFFGVGLVLIPIGTLLSTKIHFFLFVLGWVFQFLGHYVFEKKSPAFYKNLQHVVLSPLWILANIPFFKKKLQHGR